MNKSGKTKKSISFMLFFFLEVDRLFAQSAGAVEYTSYFSAEG